MAGEVFQDVEGAVKSLVPLLSQLAGAINGVETSLENLDNTTKETAKTQDDLKKKTNANTDAVKKLTKAEKAEAEILRLATKAGKKEIDAQVRLTAARKKSREEAQKNNNIIKKSGGLFKSMTKSILAASAGLFGLRAAFNVIKKGAKTIVDFEKKMSEVKAITAATDEEFEALEKNALLLGRTTSKTASEVAQLEKEFAKLGFSTAEILAATEATIDLSIAAGTDLANAAVVAASTVRGFGLDATETKRVVDVMANSFVSSALDLEKFKTAMAIIAPVAKASGKSIEFATSQVAILANAGVDASTAGTSLRNIFLELNKQGLTWEEGLDKINTSTNKNVTALELFGKRGATAALILAENIENADELKTSFDNVEVSAKDLAKTMEDNLAGDIKKAASAWEGFILGLNDGTGALSKAGRGVIKFGTDAIRSLNTLDLWFKSEKRFTSDDFDRLLENMDFVKTESGKTAREIIDNFEELNKGLSTEDLLKRGAEFKNLFKAEGETVKSSLGLWGAYVRQREGQIQIEKDAILAAEQAAIEAAEEAERVKAALAEEEAKRQDKETAKNIKRLEKELAEKEALQLKAKQDSDALADSLVDEELALTITELDNLEQQLATELRLEMEAAKKEIELTKEKEAAKKEITDAAIEAAGQIVSDRLTAGIDEDLARSQIESDSKQKILDDELDKGAISKEEFARKSAAIDLKFRQEAAKAEKKKALYDIAIATAVAIAKVIPNPVAMAIAAALGGVQLAVVASKPLPKFEEGEVDVKGKRHSQGGIDVNIEDGESVINRGGTSNAKGLLTAINKGLIKDSDMLLPSAGKMFSGADSSELAKEHHSSIIGMEKLIKEQQLTRKAISNQPQHIHQTTWAGYKYIIKKANHTIIRKDKYFG